MDRTESDVDDEAEENDNATETNESGGTTDDDKSTESKGEWVEYKMLNLKENDVAGGFSIEDYEDNGYSFEQLQDLVIDNGWTGFTIKNGDAYFKKVNGKVTGDLLTFDGDYVTWIYAPDDRR